MTRPGPENHLRWLGDEVRRFVTVLRQDPHGAAVEHCPGWTLTDLALHLGQVHRWAEVAARDGHGRHQPPPGPREPGALADWYEQGARALVSTLAGLDPAESCWTFAPPPVTGFWRRRQALETVVHRWDAENCAGLPSPIDPALASDGVDEVVRTMFPRQVDLGRSSWPDDAVRFKASDTGDTWVLGRGSPAGEVSGPAESLLLLLWRRRGPDDEGLRVDGDVAAVRSALDRPLTP